jgi:hypothetical protein
MDRPQPLGVRVLLIPDVWICVTHSQMGTFAETELVDYRLSFTNQGKQTSIFCFCMQQTNGSLLFLFSVCSKLMEIAISR